ncbi:arf-GAP with coiled-coil, ANK repeat and PH domain-containing protein 2-like [Oncorhynchus masou masou]|uniref:arf-GAP with coiled-coil, ANK repeat and PH domain-containing protein 2-like n=1 Tax=Oncorhynchus masou masou TaxID=90313 RepID=UPI00318376BE
MLNDVTGLGRILYDFYEFRINVLQSKRRSEILKSMLSFMYAHLTYFHQGYDLFSELQPLMKQLGGQVGLYPIYSH